MTRKSILLIVIFIISFQIYAQDVYFKTGLNNTSYDFKDKNGERISGLVKGIGSSYELGIGFPFAQDWFKNEFGISLDSYNSTGGDLNNNYSWDTNYGGIKNTFSFFPTTGELNFGILALSSASTILNGSQGLNNSRYDLKRQPEFNGIFFQVGLGLSVSYNIFNQGFLSLQYDYSKSFRVGEMTEEKLSFINNRILFGIHFQLN
jgi:hypothetical protein